MKEPWLRLQYTLPSVRDEESPDRRPPVTVKFEIPYYTVSGIQVRYLKVRCSFMLCFDSCLQLVRLLRRVDMLLFLGCVICATVETINSGFSFLEFKTNNNI